MISIIAALSNNNVIGKKNSLCWKIKEDIKWFKKKTINKTIIMGNKTWKSIKKPLKKRINIIISSKIKKKYILYKKNTQIIFVKSIIQALYTAKKTNKEIMIIGGEKIYSQLIKWSNKMYLTYINKNILGDKFFPKYNNKEWRIIYRKKKYIKNKKINYIIFNILIKI